MTEKNNSSYFSIHYLKSLLHQTSGSGERAENEDAWVLLWLTCNKLLGHQVHPVPKWGDQADTRVPVEGGQLVLLDAAENVSDWRPGWSGELTINTANKFVNILLQLLVLLDISSGGDGHLEKKYFTEIHVMSRALKHLQ